MIAGLITAFLFNAVILLLSDGSLYAYLFSSVTWTINCLFLLVFLLILPWFSLGYLLATLIMVALSVVASFILLTGRLLSSGVSTVVERASLVLAALGQSNGPLDIPSPGLVRMMLAVEKVSQIPSRDIVGYLLLILLSLVVMVFLLLSLERE